jgi:hypothetical protein
VVYRGDYPDAAARAMLDEAGVRIERWDGEEERS